MKIIYGYILRVFGKFLFIVMVSALTLFIAVDFSEKFDDLMEASVSWLDITKYFACKIPSIIKDVTIPVVAVGTLVAYEVLTHRREILAIHASGISPRRYVKTIILVSLVISIGYLGFIDTVERPLRIQAKTFWSERIKKLSDQALTFKQIKKGEIWYATRHIICHIMYYDPNSKSFHGVSISLVDDDFKIRRKINTAVMTWGGNQWIAENATIIDFEKEGASLKKVASLPIEIQETPADLSIFQTPMEDLSIRDIIHVISLMHREGVNFQSYLMELMLRLANALAIVVSVALAIAILARYSRCSLRSEVKSGVYAIIGFGLFFGLFQLGVGLAASSSVPMFLGVWGGHIAAVAIALLLLSK